MLKVPLLLNVIRIIPLVVILQSARCSMVIDSYAQKSLYVSDYCPHMKYCSEGTHVMCMYFDPNRTYGPRCSNPRNITITPDLASQLLDILNAIRSKIALGKETGFNNTKLPRGYGIFRLKWDNELATFAQVFANQCILRHDFCRATKRFAEPGQTAGLMRFTYPGWDPITATTSTGLNDDKLSYAVAQIVKSWYTQKVVVTEEMVNEYPNWEMRPNLSGRLYLELIHGSITHMGCGISAYTEFIYYQNRPVDGRPGGKNYNSVEIICNFSHRPKTGQKSYLTTRAKHPYTGQCGCPEGSKEDDDCLCNEVPFVREQAKTRGVNIGVQAEPETCSNPDNNCEPTLVLLPIFTVEDAPPEKVMQRARGIEGPLANFVIDRLDNKSSLMSNAKSVEILNYVDDRLQLQPGLSQPLKSAAISNQNIESLSKAAASAISLPTLKRNMVRYRTDLTAKVRHQNSEQDLGHEHGQEDHTVVAKRKTVLKHPIKRLPTQNKSKKSSIFTRVAKFKLPNSRKRISQHDVIKTDVKPRKDFKNVQRVVTDYFKRHNIKAYRRHDPISSKRKDKIEKITVPTTTKYIDHVTTEHKLSSAEEKVMNFNQFLSHRHNSSGDKNFDLGNEDSDNKLMSLLDTLEREVRHIDLDVNEKEKINAKIRKIYDTVIGRANMLDMSKNSPKSESQLFQHRNDRPSDILDRVFNNPKTFHKYDNNNIDLKDLQIRNYLLDFLDTKDVKYKSKNKDAKNYPDIFENKSFNDNDLFDTDQKIFSDIEQKYNERLIRSKLDRKYPDDEYAERNYVETSRNSNIPATRTQNAYPKYKTITRQRASSGEERKSINFDKIRDREPRLDLPREDTDRNYYRNLDDDRKFIPPDSKRSTYTNNDLENQLSSERRKYYQEKLENLERKLHGSRNYRQRNRKKDVRANERATLRMRPNGDEADGIRRIKVPVDDADGLRRMKPNVDDSDNLRRMKTKSDPFYIADRARYLHNF